MLVNIELWDNEKIWISLNSISLSIVLKKEVGINGEIIYC